jgi:hypothetical protein
MWYNEVKWNRMGSLAIYGESPVHVSDINLVGS